MNIPIRSILLTALAAAIVAGPAWSATGAITASPNPCVIPQGGRDCTTYVTWSTQGALHAAVFVRGEGRHNIPEKEFVNGRSCEGQKCGASWIGPDTKYIFTLYDTSSGSRGPALASAEVTAIAPAHPAANVTGVGSGNITASPNPCRVPPGRHDCTTYLTWSVQNVQRARVYVEAVGKTAEKGFADASSCEGRQCPATWIEPGVNYVFTLADFSDGHKAAALATVTVTATQ